MPSQTIVMRAPILMADHCYKVGDVVKPEHLAQCKRAALKHLFAVGRLALRDGDAILDAGASALQLNTHTGRKGMR